MIRFDNVAEIKSHQHYVAHAVLYTNKLTLSYFLNYVVYFFLSSLGQNISINKCCPIYLKDLKVMLLQRSRCNQVASTWRSHYRRSGPRKNNRNCSYLGTYSYIAPII